MCNRGFCKVLVLEPQHWFGWLMGHEECCLASTFSSLPFHWKLHVRSEGNRYLGLSGPSGNGWYVLLLGTMASWAFCHWWWNVAKSLCIPHKSWSGCLASGSFLPLGPWWLHLPTTFQLWLNTSGVYLSLFAHGTIAYTSVQLFPLPLYESNTFTEAVDTLVVFKQRFCSLRTLFLWNRGIIAVPQDIRVYRNRSAKNGTGLHSHSALCWRSQQYFRYCNFLGGNCSFTCSRAVLRAETASALGLPFLPKIPLACCTVYGVCEMCTSVWSLTKAVNTLLLSVGWQHIL